MQFSNDDVDKEIGMDMIPFGVKRESGVIEEMKVSKREEERQSDRLLLNSFDNSASQFIE